MGGQNKREVPELLLHLGVFEFSWDKGLYRGLGTPGLGTFLSRGICSPAKAWLVVGQLCAAGRLRTRNRDLPLLLAGAVLLDLEQTTLPGIAHLMVETMIISDQIRAEDRANVLRALLLKHRWVVHG